MKYRSKRGSFNLGMRVERGSALLATLYANRNSKNGDFKLSDFMPHDHEHPDDMELTIEEAMATWH
nr:hypothetical protein [Marinobacter sp. BGYM27]